MMENDSFYSIKKNVISLICIFLLVGCFSPGTYQQTPVVTPTVFILENDPMIYTETLVPIEKTLEQVENYLVPTKVVPIPTTQSPKATMSAEEAKNYFTDMIQNNGRCKLPCFLGLSPQKTDIQTILSFIKQFGINSSNSDIDIYSNTSNTDKGKLEINLIENDSRVNISINYFIVNQKLEQIFLSTEAIYEQEGGGAHIVFGDLYYNQILNYFFFSKILTNYGKPSQILLLPILYDAPNIVDDEISLVLLYPEQGFFIEYIFPIKSEGEVFVGCPDHTGYINVAAWSVENGFSLEKLVKRNPGIGLNELSLKYYKPLEETTNLTVDEFYTIFKGTNTSNCLKTAKALWPN